MVTETILLQDRRRRLANWLNRIPLALSAVVLAEAALPRLEAGAGREVAFAAAELVAAVLLVIVLVVAWRRRHRGSSGFGWIDLTAAERGLAARA